MSDSYFWKPFAQGVATPVVLIGGTNLLLKDFKVSNPYLYWGGLAASSAVVVGILADKIKVPILNAESFNAEHFDDVAPLDGPCLHCGNDMFTEAHKSWFCDRESGGCGIVAHFVNPFEAESFSADSQTFEARNMMVRLQEVDGEAPHYNCPYCRNELTVLGGKGGIVAVCENESRCNGLELPRQFLEDYEKYHWYVNERSSAETFGAEMTKVKITAKGGKETMVEIPTKIPHPFENSTINTKNVSENAQLESYVGDWIRDNHGDFYDFKIMGAESFNAEGFEDQLDHVLSYGKIYCSNCKKESPDYDYSCINCGSLNTDAGNPEQSHMMQGYWIDGDNSPELYEAETFEAKVYDPMMQKKIDKNECKHRYDDGEDAWVMKYSELLGVEDGLSYVEAGVKCEICSQERIGSWGINEKEGFQITKGDEGRIPKWSIGFYGAETFESDYDDEKIRDWLKTNYMTFNELLENHYTYEGLMAWLSENHDEVYEEWMDSNRMDAETFGERDSANMRELRKILEREIPILVQQINKIEKHLKSLERGIPMEYPIINIRDNLDNMTKVIGDIWNQKIDYLSHYEAETFEAPKDPPYVINGRKRIMTWKEVARGYKKEYDYENWREADKQIDYLKNVQEYLEECNDEEFEGWFRNIDDPSMSNFAFDYKGIWGNNTDRDERMKYMGHYINMLRQAKEDMFPESFYDAETFNSDSHTDSFMAEMPVNAVKNEHGEGWTIDSVHRRDYKETFKNWKPSKYPYEKRITQDSVNEACNSCGKKNVHYQFYLDRKNSVNPKMRFIDSATYCQYDPNTCGGNICRDCADNNDSCENCGAEICEFCRVENYYDNSDLVCVDCREFNESLEDD